MNIDGSIQFGKSNCAVLPSNNRSAFTLIEILVVVAIVGVLMAALGGVLANTARKAREAATIATIQKVDGLLQDRIKGFERYTKTRDFQRLVDYQKTIWDSAYYVPTPGVSRKFAEAAIRKDLFRISFPQHFSEPVDMAGTTALAKILADPTTKPYNTLGTHKAETESAAVLYYVVSRMQIFGVAPVAESEFSTSEVADTDQDGLLEFVDGWGRPLRFYRWPTRLLKPNGVGGLDGKFGVAGVDDDGAHGTDDPGEIEWSGSDDVSDVPLNVRTTAGLLIDGLPNRPVILGQWDSLNADSDDAYGMAWSEIIRQMNPQPPNPPTPIDLTVAPPGPGPSYGLTGYREPRYPTLDTFHTPLIVSVGPDNDLGLYEPNFTEDLNSNGLLDSGEDLNGNTILDIGVLAQPRNITISAGPPVQFVIPTDVFSALSDNITNRNRRAGKGK